MLATEQVLLSGHLSISATNCNWLCSYKRRFCCLCCASLSVLATHNYMDTITRHTQQQTISMKVACLQVCCVCWLARSLRDDDDDEKRIDSRAANFVRATQTHASLARAAINLGLILSVCVRVAALAMKLCQRHKRINQVEGVAALASRANNNQQFNSFLFPLCSCLLCFLFRVSAARKLKDDQTHTKNMAPTHLEAGKKSANSICYVDSSAHAIKWCKLCVCVCVGRRLLRHLRN